MSINIGDNLSYLGAKPLDGRLKYDTMSEMAGMADNVLYEGCLAYCVGTGKTYQWKSTNAVDPTTGKWREFTSGGGTAEDPIEYVSQLPTSGIEDKIYGLAITGQISRTIDLINPVQGQPTKQQAIDYFSKYFTVTDVDADNIELSVYPDLVLSRDNWGSNDWVAGRDFNKLYYNVSLAEINAYMDSTEFASTGAWGATSQYYIHCTSEYFPVYKYYAGVESTQELNEIGGGSADIDNDTIVENQDGEISVSPAYKKIFDGTLEEWNALTTAEKKEYDNVSTPDPTSAEALVDAVENGNMNAVTSNAVYDAISYRQSSSVVCVFRRMKSDGSGVEATGSTRQCLVLPLVGSEKLALIIGDGEVNVNTTENQQKFSFALSGIASNGIVNDGCLNIAIEGQPSPNLGYAGGFGDFWVNGIPTGLSNTKCRARFMCVCKLQ